jgi:hypothetical protein
MGNFFGNTGESPFNEELIRSLTAGTYYDKENSENRSYLLEYDNTNANTFQRALDVELGNRGWLPGGAQGGEWDDNNHSANEFSLLRSAVRAYSGGEALDKQFNHTWDNNRYLRGPFVVAARELIDGFRAIRSDGIVSAVTQGDGADVGATSDNWAGMIGATLRMRPRSEAILDSEAFYKFELDVSKVGSSGVYKTFMDAANEAVVDQFSMIFTQEDNSSKYEELWGIIDQSPASNDQYSAYNPTLTAPSSSSIASQQSVDEPTPASVGSAPTIDAPLPVFVDDNIDDAVAAFTAQQELRYAEEEARLRASFFGGRAVMSTFFDVALANLTAQKNAQIAAYDKELRVEQSRQQMQADTNYQQHLMEQRTRQAQIDADHVRLEVDTALKNAEQLILAQSKNADHEVEFQRINLQEYLGYLDALSKHNSLAAEVARIAQEFVFKKRDENYQYWATEMKQKIEVLATLYQSFVAFAGGNNSAAGVLSQLLQIDHRESVYRRDQEFSWKQFNMATANQMANALHAFTEYKWKAQLQDLMVIKEAMSAFASVNAGTEHHTSPFEKTMQVASGALGVVSSIANLGMILGG